MFFNLRMAVAIALCLVILAGCAPLIRPALSGENKTTQNTAHQQSITQAVPLPSAHVPAEYRLLYDSLSGKLDAFDKSVDKQCAATNRNIVFAAEWLGANCHAGEQLFNPSYYQGTVAWLDALKTIGVTGVKIALDYPFLMPDFPNCSRYIKVYKNLVSECRSRNMTVFIANGNLFGPPFTNLKYPLTGLTLDKYREGKRQTVETIIRELHPDYLSVANEPTTEKMLTGIDQTPAQFAATTRYIVQGLEHKGTLMGSGVGSWSNMDYVRELTKIPELDYIDIHIYPVEYVQGAMDAAVIARANNKRLALAEIGLYKMRQDEMGGLGKLATQATIYGRDMFSFWGPLDSRFLEIVVKMAKCEGYEFISPFWSTCLFGYLDYNDANKNLAYNQLRQRSNLLAYQNSSSGKLSAWGETYKKLIAANSADK